GQREDLRTERPRVDYREAAYRFLSAGTIGRFQVQNGTPPFTGKEVDRSECAANSEFPHFLHLAVAVLRLSFLGGLGFQSQNRDMLHRNLLRKDCMSGAAVEGVIDENFRLPWRHEMRAAANPTISNNPRRIMANSDAQYAYIRRIHCRRAECAHR